MATDARLLYKRNWARTKKHGDWRRTAWNSGFVCAAAPGDGTFPDGCYYDYSLEFHEPFGEQLGLMENPRFQTRVMLCKNCHRVEHNMRFSLARGAASLVHIDIEKEIMDMGYRNWLKEYIA